jgi:small-conductance mechanosensitive channel
MATNRPGQNSDHAPRRGLLTRVRLFSAVGLFVVLVLCLAFSWNTRDAMALLPFLKGQGAAARRATGQTPLVDLSPWQTAHTLAAVAVTAEEKDFAREAERIADHEVDQVFAAALRQASLKHISLTGEALALSQKVGQLQQTVKEDQARLQSLTQQANVSASPATTVSATEDLDVAKAQLGLDSDELADAQQELARAGGDERGRVQQELAAHEAVMRKYSAEADNKGQVAVVSALQHGSLARRIEAWFAQSTRYELVQQAMQKAQADAAALTDQRKELESQTTAADPATDKSATLAALKKMTARSQLLGIYTDRIQSQQQLAAIYQKWSAQLLRQHRIVLHLVLQSFALIAFILICVIVFGALVCHLAERPTLDRRRVQTLRIIFTLGIQSLGVLLVLFVVFGIPSQLPTILGLTTAGLTVALQDFIIAFFGWFVLMGKNGIRIGDRVEINGVGGEAVEIGVFRTTLLEMGNWTDKGHPTGRRVAFLNSFAIKGQYFNFSTTGQWMWDEIRLSIPAGDDAYDIVDLIHKAVVKETEKETRLAEEEWSRGASGNALSQLTAIPAVNMRPAASGIDIIVRYVTRASDRFEVRNRLYQCVIDLLHKHKRPAPRLQADPPEPRFT